MWLCEEGSHEVSLTKIFNYQSHAMQLKTEELSDSGDVTVNEAPGLPLLQKGH